MSINRKNVNDVSEESRFEQNLIDFIQKNIGNFKQHGFYVTCFTTGGWNFHSILFSWKHNTNTIAPNINYTSQH